MNRLTWITIGVFSIAAITVVYYFLNQSGVSTDLPSKVSYNYHIRPILADKCFACHGPDKNHQEAGLRLDLAAAAYAPLKETKGRFAIVPGSPEQSEMIQRITSKDPSYRMPTPESHLAPLNDSEIALLKKWIEQGAVYEPHWSFVSPVKLPLPQVSNTAWPSNEIDYFILSGIERMGLTPNEEANKEQLLKRVYIDLIGLPPTAEQVDSFISNKSEAAFEKLVDNLLNSRHFGEKMALYWLDVARYADSYGYQDDNIRTQWAWRDWVIHAFNSNMPYDQFLTWQLAGDLLPNPTKEQLLATAFLRNHKYTEEGGVIPEEYRVEYHIDKTKTYSKGILGLTIECAQCHDHKYDPISQEDYYQLFAFFNNSAENGFEGDVSVSKPAKTPYLVINKEDIASILKFIHPVDTSALMVSIMGDIDTVRNTYILQRGAYDQPGKPVKAAAPEVVMPFESAKYPANRLGLAQWTVHPKNPLTARVFVNHIWQEIFGRGLVKTAGDFGLQGELPSHPELLDWLAADFTENNWNIKRFIKKIILSSTYKQSAVITDRHLLKDPENVYLSRAPRLRVKAEIVRDIVLSSAGLLHPAIGGPSVKPYQPKNLWESASSGRGALATYEESTGKDLYRRGMYTFIKLTVPPPSMAIFDASNRDQCEVQRLRTSTPLQALNLMNDPMVMEASYTLAKSLLSSATAPERNITIAFKKILCRTPTKWELNQLLAFHNDQLAYFKNSPLAALKISQHPEKVQPASANQEVLASMTMVINTIYNMEEAIIKT